MRRPRAIVLAAVAVLIGVGSCAAAQSQAPAASAAPTAPAVPAVPKEAERTAPEAPRREAEDADDAPDLAFLEYLGSWQADDDEWLLIAEWEKDQARNADENDGNTRAARRAAEAEARRGRAERKDDEEGG